MEILSKWEEPAIRVLMMPRDTNAQGTIFGGVILSYIDQAGAIEARRQGSNVMVTVAMDKIVFHQPVFVGDLISFWCETLRIGTTSMECLPDSLAGRRFYEPKDVGLEREIKERLEKMRAARSASASDPDRD